MKLRLSILLILGLFSWSEPVFADGLIIQGAPPDWPDMARRSLLGESAEQRAVSLILLRNYADRVKAVEWESHDMLVIYAIDLGLSPETLHKAACELINGPGVSLGSTRIRVLDYIDKWFFGGTRVLAEAPCS